MLIKQNRLINIAVHRYCAVSYQSVRPGCMVRIRMPKILVYGLYTFFLIYIWRWEPDRRFNFSFSPPSHIFTVTYITEISLHVTLRRCKTAITWLRSLSAILPLFWRHDIAELHRLCREDCRNVLWRHEICDVFPRIMTCALQNMQFSQYFTTKFNIFSLNLTGGSNFFILFISTHNKLSMSRFNKIWMIRFFAVVNYIGRTFSFCSNL